MGLSNCFGAFDSCKDTRDTQSSQGIKLLKVLSGFLILLPFMYMAGYK